MWILTSQDMELSITVGALPSADKRKELRHIDFSDFFQGTSPELALPIEGISKFR
tara:strand:- start:1246 stop:1410 length:165 start_codon:yes stop_codon:yes gene_type:complete